MKTKELLELNKEKIYETLLSKNKSNVLFSLALIRNDLLDLIYLHDLFIQDNKNISNELSSKLGRYSGRRIYIMRLILSHYYEFLYLLNKRNDQINNDILFKEIIKTLNKKEKIIWNNFNLIAKDICNKQDNIFLNKNSKLYKVSLLAYCVRNDLTFHYYGTVSYLKTGFIQAFLKDELKFNNKNPFVTELNGVNLNRAYYIDLSIQRFLEIKLNIKNLFDYENEIIDVIGQVNFLLDKILYRFHSKMKF